MLAEKDTTPLTEKLEDIARAEGLAKEGPKGPTLSINGKRVGRPPKDGAPSGPSKRDYAREKAQKDARTAARKPTPGPTPAEAVPDEPPFSVAELRDVMNKVGSALFALPGEIMVSRRPDLAHIVRVSEKDAAFGGKAVVYYVAKRFPDLLEKWGPEAFLLGAVAIVYGPRAVVMATTKPGDVAPPPDETTVEGSSQPV